MKELLKKVGIVLVAIPVYAAIAYVVWHAFGPLIIATLIAMIIAKGLS